MARKKKEKPVIKKTQEIKIPEGVELGRIRDMANDCNINHIRYTYGRKNIDRTMPKRLHFALFLGAGASKESNIKLAWEMMEDFKKIILADEGLTFDDKKAKDTWFAEQDWFSKSKNKYSCLFQRAYKTDIDRRNYIEDVISEGEASLGYIILANFIAENYVNTIITTNFDDLVYQGCTSYTAVRPVVYSLGGFASEMSSMIERPKVLKIHGDFLFSELKNTEDELAEQDPNMSKQVEEILAKYEGLIVIGYGGADESVMKLLKRIPRGHSLYWCAMSKMVDGKRTIELDEKVSELLKEKKGKLIEINGFDRLMKKILEVVEFDEDIIVKAFEKRQNKLNEELHKFDKVTIDGEDQESKDYEKKDETFTDKIEHVFDNIILGNKAKEEWKSKNYAEQEKIARQMIKNNPKESYGYVILALALKEKGENFEEAEENYKKAIELNPNEPMTYNSLGVLLAKDEKRWSEAEENYNKALKLNPNDANVYFNLACLRSISGKEENKAEAFEYLKKAIELDSKFNEIAQSDADFDFVRDDGRFKEIVTGG